MAIEISDHFTYPRLIRFVLPSMAMMVFTSIYGVVDGLFVSNCVGKTAFASINLIMPFFTIIATFGFMLGTGGSALVAKKMGEGKNQDANEIFTMLVAAAFCFGILLCLILFNFIEPICRLLGATDAMLPYCITYGRITLIFNTAFFMQNMFQSFMIAASKPKLGFMITIGAGITNMILDALLVWYLQMGVFGAALATGISQSVGGFLPLLYFVFDRNSTLRFTRLRLRLKDFGQACFNGISEFLSNASSSVIGLVYNLQLLRFAGENGVAVYGVIMYVSWIFYAIIIGYSIGSAPIFSYHYGAENHDELRNMLKKSLVIMGALGVLMTVGMGLLAKPFTALYIGYDGEVLRMSRQAAYIFMYTYLFTTFNIFASSFFTALNNGLVSGTISFLRTFVFQLLALLILPEFFGLQGIYSASVVADALCLGVSAYFILSRRKQYGY